MKKKFIILLLIALLIIISNFSVLVIATETDALTPVDLSMPKSEYNESNIKKWYSAGPYRLQYHFSAPKNWINDPAGLIQWQDKYHLFYQYNPEKPEWGPMHWGHAVSKDLIHWEHLPIALAPPKKDNFEDNSGCFTGVSVANKGKLNLLYTTFKDQNFHPDATEETQSLATSEDGINFKKYKGNPVLEKVPPKSTAGFRDPYVWKEGEDWKMIVGSGDGSKGKLPLYKSSDLKNWEYLGVLYKGNPGTMWECPNFFKLGSKYVLLVSVNESRKQGAYYFVGEYKDNKFIPENKGRLDFGPDFYAPQVFKDKHGRAIMIGWMDHWGGIKPTQKTGWAGAMTIPRKLTLLPGGKVGVKPVEELKKLRSEKYHRDNIIIKPDDSGYLTEVKGRTLEVIAEFKVISEQLEQFGLKLRQSPGGREETIVGYRPDTEELSINRNLSGIGEKGIEKATVELKKDNILRLHIYLDRSSIEVFANDGQEVGSVRIYPRWQESQGLDIFSRGGKVRLESITIWDLKSAWK